MDSNGHKQNAIDPDRVKLFKISRKIKENEFQDLKYLCKNYIPAGELEKIKRVLDLFSKIENMSSTKEENHKLIERLLRDIGRVDLCNELNNIPQPVGNGTSNLSIKRIDEPTPSISIVDNDIKLIIVDRMNKDWRRFGLYLGLSDHVLESIDIDKKSVNDKTYAVLIEWMKKENATKDNLIKALTKMPRKDILRVIDKHEESKCADKIADKVTDDVKTSVQETGEDITSEMEKIAISDAEPNMPQESATECSFVVNVHGGRNIIGNNNNINIYSNEDPSEFGNEGKESP